MTLAENIFEYRMEHNYSIREFARICDLSHVQLYFMERGKNSDGKPFTPTIQSIQKVATGMGLTFYELASISDDLSEFRVNPIDKSKLNPANRTLMAWAEELPPEQALAFCKAFNLVVK